MGAVSCLFFFFSSRRRHTRFDCDWSSDVCSSDLSPSPARRWDTRRGTPCRPQPPRRSASRCDTRGRRSATLPEKRSEEHTSELQSQSNLVCRLLLEKKKKKTKNMNNTHNSRNSEHAD